MTFDVRAQQYATTRHGWQNWYEIFSICRRCQTGTIFVVALSVDGHRFQDVFYVDDGLVKFGDSLNPYFEIKGFINTSNLVSLTPPDHLPEEIKLSFEEGAACLSINCFNAAAAMFRLCIDIATRPLLPEPATEGPQPNSRTRRDLGLRLAWLFDQGRLPPSLRALATCIREDGNDGAHAGNLEKADAEDVADFTTALLERLITEPRRLELAQARREERRRPKADGLT